MDKKIYETLAKRIVDGCHGNVRYQASVINEASEIIYKACEAAVEAEQERYAELLHEWLKAECGYSIGHAQVVSNYVRRIKPHVSLAQLRSNRA